MAQSDPPTNATPSAEGLEYRSADDAWYNVNVSLKDDILTIKYSMLSGSPEEEFHDAKIFKSLDDVVRFRNRFRPLSLQVQDTECRSLVPGVKVCSAYRAGEDDLRYYDAVVEQVDHNAHTFQNGEEQCLCKFILFWEHGPGAGYLTTATVEDICRLRDGEIDETLDEFIETARGMVIRSIIHSGVPVQASVGDLDAKSQPLNGRKEDCSEPINQDTDLGGEVMTLKKFMKSGCSYGVVINNMEKDLTPLTAAKFILKETTIKSKAYIFPSLLTDTCTRGVIEVFSREDFIKLNDFLDNPNQIIVSSRNRPWVVTERLWKGEVRTIVQTLGGDQTHSAKSGSKLKILLYETPEYNIASQHRENFTEFYCHLKCMVEGMAFEEQRIKASR